MAGRRPPFKTDEGVPVGAVTDLYDSVPQRTLAVDHYRKMCAGCHLWKERGDHEEEAGKRGGGCSDCHVIDDGKKRSPADGSFEHPPLTTRIPSENCVKCHNRSARIGLSYFGRFESAGYGTPYEGADLSSRRLSGNRHYLDLPADVHFSKAGMECIDCHTAVGIMGDGRIHNQMADQVDITCDACHHPRFSKGGEVSALARRMVSLNQKTPPLNKEEIAVTRKGTPLYTLRKEGDQTVFYRRKMVFLFRSTLLLRKSRTTRSKAMAPCPVRRVTVYGFPSVSDVILPTVKPEGNTTGFQTKRHQEAGKRHAPISAFQSRPLACGTIGRVPHYAVPGVRVGL